MIKTDKGTIILESRPEIEFENEGVFNPACIEKNGLIYMFYRAVRKENFSTIGFCQLKDNQVISRSDKPILFPEFSYESHGIEDPQITFIDGQYYLFYTAYDGQNALIAYAISDDLKVFIKKGIISPQITYDEAEDIFRNTGIINKYIYFEKIFKRSRGQGVYLWEKDATLFPKKINGRYALLHRILPGIQICYFDNFNQLTPDFWRQYLKKLNDFIVLDPKYHFENVQIGGGCNPVEIPQGWLLIYHSVQENISEGRMYNTCVALLDKDDPQKVIGRLPYPLFSPEHTWEKQGFVDNVVFPTAAILKGDLLSIYYGAADTRIGVRTVVLSDLLKELSL